MSKISINNGASYVDVSDLSDEDVSRVLESGLLDQRIGDAVDLPESASGREWLDAYCGLYEGAHLVPFVFG